MDTPEQIRKREKRSVKNKIIINPTMNDIKEQTNRVAVIGWGRMNPITIGHEKLVDKLNSVAKQARGTPLLFLSHSQDKKKNPLLYADKIRLARKAFGNIVKMSQAKTLIEILKSLEGDFHDIILVAGADRVPEFQNLLDKYNGKEYTFDTIKVVSAGERDPDADDVTGMSASKMRAAIVNNDVAAVKAGLPSKLKNDWKEVMDLVKAGLKLAEELEAIGTDLETLDETLSMAQRLKRRQVMKRNKSRIKLARERALRRRANMREIRKRARRTAINRFKQVLAGGRDVEKLSPAEKNRLELFIARRKKLIARLTTKLMREVRKKDADRLKNESYEVDDMRELFAIIDGMIELNRV